LTHQGCQQEMRQCKLHPAAAGSKIKERQNLSIVMEMKNILSYEKSLLKSNVCELPIFHFKRLREPH
jgi:hypothetical protein